MLGNLDKVTRAKNQFDEHFAWLYVVLTLALIAVIDWGALLNF